MLRKEKKCTPLDCWAVPFLVSRCPWFRNHPWFQNHFFGFRISLGCRIIGFGFRITRFWLQNHPWFNPLISFESCEGRGERRDGGRRSYQDGERGRSYQDEPESLMLHDVAWCYTGNVPHNFLLRKNGVTVISETLRTVVGVTMADKASKTGRGGSLGFSTIKAYYLKQAWK